VTPPSISIRPARADDHAFIIATAQRLSGFGPPPWRTESEVVDGEVRTLEAFFSKPDPSAELLIAHGTDDQRLGFMYLEQLRDYFTLEAHGHIGIIAVTERAEGTGAGQGLMRAAEEWARGRGYRKLTLSVFEHNRRARRLYEHVGFAPDTIRYLKAL
jgi:ribosomal protein S18 acetylase RimI-like enzyme